MCTRTFLASQAVVWWMCVWMHVLTVVKQDVVVCLLLLQYRHPRVVSGTASGLFFCVVDKRIHPLSTCVGALGCV